MDALSVTSSSSPEAESPARKRARTSRRRRSARCPSWPSGSTSSEDYGRRKIRKQAHHQDSSKVSREELAKYLDVDTSGCPTDTHHGEPLQGTTPNELVQDLLNDMQNKQFPFPVKTYEDMVRDTTGSMPKFARHKQKKVISHLQGLLNKVDIKEGNPKQFMYSYRPLCFETALSCEELQSVTINSGASDDSNRSKDANIDYALDVLEPLHRFLERVTRTINDKSSNEHIEQTAHRCYVQFWTALLKYTQCILRTPTANDLKYELSSILTTGKNVPVTLQGHDLPTVEFRTKPDVLCETVSRDAAHRDIVYRTLAIAVQTQRLTKVPHTKSVLSDDSTAQKYSSPSDSSDSSVLFRARIKHGCGPAIAGTSKGSRIHSDRCKTPNTREPAQRRTHDLGSSDGSEDDYCKEQDLDRSRDPSYPGLESLKATPPMDPSLDSMLTRHVLELLGMFTSPDADGRLMGPMAHGIGVYIVMHRVYITGLFVDPRLDWPMRLRHCMPTSGMKYQLKCCKYFNLFKPGHLTALMDVLHYLVFHQHKVNHLF